MTMTDFICRKISAVSFSVAFLVLACLQVPAESRESKTAGTDGRGNELVSLWKEYRKMQEEDRPDREEAVLEKIIAKAEDRHVAWDFYEAWKEYRNSVLSRDWKRRETVDSSLAESVRQFGEPVVTFAVDRAIFRNRTDVSGMLEDLKVNAAGLKTVRNSRFYGEGYNTVPGSAWNCIPSPVIQDIANDYEYILWTLFLETEGMDDEIRLMLSQSVSGRYPSEPYMEYCMASSGPADGSGKRAALEAFAEKHEGRAVACYALQDLLSLRMNDMLQSDVKPSSAGFRKLRQECADFEKMRKSFSGKEKDIAAVCTRVKDIISRLDSKTIRVEGSSDTLSVLLRNTDGFRIEVRPSAKDDPEPVFMADVRNPENSFYILDTVKVALPELDDGEYLVKCFSKSGKTSAVYRQYTVSAAYRTSGGGIAVYAADSQSGKPLERAGVRFFKGDSLVLSVEGLSFDRGFVPIPADFIRDTENPYAYSLVCSCRDADGRLRSSGKVSLDLPVSGGTDYAKEVSAEIFKDRGVYNPGDTLYFKTVLFRESGSATGLEVLPAGEEVTMVLSGPRNQVRDSLLLCTNGFGSVSGAFTIPAGALGGRYFLEAYYSSSQVASSSLIAGDIDIPTYSLEFDEDRTLHFPGDSIIVEGTVTSHTGHSLSSAELLWQADGRDFKAGGKADISGDGRFSFGFRTEDNDGYSYYNIKVKVTDAAGETLEFGKSISAAPVFTMDASLDNEPDGIVSPSEPWKYSPMTGYSMSLTEGNTARLCFTVRNTDYIPVDDVPVDYAVYHSDELIQAGRVFSGDSLDVRLTGDGSGTYRVEAEASAVMELPDGTDSLIVYRYIYDLVRTSAGDTALDAGVEHLFKVIEDDDIVLQAGTASGPMWAVVELWGEDPDTPLLADMVRLAGERGKDGSLKELRYKYEDSYPDETRLEVFWFRGGKDCRYSAVYDRKQSGLDLPLEFVSFTDTAGPGTDVTLSLKTAPGTEAVISVFDKGTEQIMPNSWHGIYRRSRVPCVRIFAGNGFTGCRHLYLRGGTPVYTAVSKAAPAANGATSVTQEAGFASGMMMEDASAVDEASGMLSVQSGYIRSYFGNTLAFIPFVKSEDDGSVSVSFRTSDKLSTYRVSVFAHDKSVHNGLVTGEMTVSKPVMVSVAGPQFLREGDRYVLRAPVSNNTGEDISGVLELFVYDTEDYDNACPLVVRSAPVSVGDRESETASFVLDVPSGTGLLGFRLVFEGETSSSEASGTSEHIRQWSDGMFFTVKVLPDTQILRETHSSVLLPGMDADSLETALAGRFVNTLPYGAVTTEISLLDMVKSAIPGKSGSAGKDAVSMSDALFTMILTGCVSGEAVESLAEKIAACQNRDGGFAWFSGMDSSPVITAQLLERAAEISDRAHVEILTEEQVQAAIEYLDAGFLETGGATGRLPGTAGLTVPEYLYVRSKFSLIPLGLPEDFPDGRRILKSLGKAVKSYLTCPTGADGFDGKMADKARRVSVTMAFLEEGAAYPECLGLGNAVMRKAAGMMEADVASLCGYAVEHASGGVYFPNAVMPFRGLLDSELYTHSLICDVLRDYASWQGSGSIRRDPALSAKAAGVADGVRLWMMIQKETQQWDEDPSCVRAMASVLDGSDEVLSTRIAVMSKQYEKPFGQIAASGNGFKVTRRFYIGVPSPDSVSGETLAELQPGDTLSVGDRVVCRYEIWSAENRSFVRLSVPHHASFRPADQVSGLSGWWRGPASCVLGRYPAARAYRNVTDDRTEYYFDLLPEETTVIEEEFHVVREGTYSSPAAEVICLYAPHYRANDAYLPPVRVPEAR